MPDTCENSCYCKQKECSHAELLMQTYFEKICAAPQEEDIVDSLYALTIADIRRLQWAWRTGDAEFGATMRYVWKRSFKTLAHMKMRNNEDDTCCVI